MRALWRLLELLKLTGLEAACQRSYTATPGSLASHGFGLWTGTNQTPYPPCFPEVKPYFSDAQLVKTQRTIAIWLDISSARRNIKLSPPIRFRIERARCQGSVTAPWQRARFNVGERNYCLRKADAHVQWCPD